MKTKMLILCILFASGVGFILLILAALNLNIQIFLISFQLFAISGIGFMILNQKNLVLEQREATGSIMLKIQNECERNYRQLDALQNILNIISPRLPLPESRGWAASPDLLRLLILILIKDKPRIILEAGSGLSTLVIAYTIEKFGLDCKIISLENNSKYYEKVKNLIELHGLSSIASVVYAPLANIEINKDVMEWYDISDKIIPSEIDLLIIDGPPAVEKNLARYPALPVLFDKLVPKCKILLDDYEREGEKTVVKMWLEKFQVAILEDHNFDKGLAVIQKK